MIKSKKGELFTSKNGCETFKLITLGGGFISILKMQGYVYQNTSLHASITKFTIFLLNKFLCFTHNIVKA